MAEFNRTALDMMDELYAPYKESAAQGRQLQRSSAGLELQRRTQVADTEAKWAHEKAGTMAKWAQDAEVARQTQLDRQSNITLELEERQRIQDETKKAERERTRQELEDDYARMWHETRNSTKEIVDGREHVRYDVKKGYLDDGIAEGDWVGATRSTLTRWGASLLEQKNTVKVMTLDRNSIIEKIHALARTPEQQMMVDEILDGVKLSDLRNPEWSKHELEELHGDIATMNHIVENPQILSEHGKLIRRRARLFNQTPLEEILKDQNNASVSALASGLASSQNLRMRLLSDDEGDLSKTEVDRIMAMLGTPENPAQGLQDAMNYVSERDEAGMVFNDEMMKWAEKNASGLATGIMARMQDYKLQMEEIQRINETVKSNLDIYPWLKAVPSTHFYNEEIMSEMDAKQPAEKPVDAAPNEDINNLAVQGGGPQPDATVGGRPTATVGVGVEGGPPAAEQSSVAQNALGRFDRNGDGVLDAYEKLLKADEEEGFASGRAGMPEGGGTISATDAKGLGTKALDYLFPKHRDIGQSDTGYSRAGAGDVAIEVGERMLDAWLYASGWNLLRNTPAALGRVRALVSKPSGLGAGAFGRTPGNPAARISALANQPTIKDMAKALGGGAALKSFQEFIKNPANVRDAYKWVREAGLDYNKLRGWRYSQGATPKLVPKTHRLNFTPAKPAGTPIVPPPPTP